MVQVFYDSTHRASPLNPIGLSLKHCKHSTYWILKVPEFLRRGHHATPTSLAYDDMSSWVRRVEMWTAVATQLAKLQLILA